MNTEKREMEKSSERDPVDIMKMVNEFKLKLDTYSELPKDKLVDRLIMCEMELTAREEETKEHMMELWYFVSDETGVKYLSNEKPEMHFDGGSKVSEHGIVTDLPNIVWLTDGEINIRVPKCMECMFPDIKPGDEPVKVSLSISF